MCTTIATSVRVAGSAKGERGWERVDEVDIGYDHATRLWTEHAVRLDVRSASGVHASVELDLASGKLLLERLSQVIEAAEGLEA